MLHTIAIATCRKLAKDHHYLLFFHAILDRPMTFLTSQMTLILSLLFAIVVRDE